MQSLYSPMHDVTACSQKESLAAKPVHKQPPQHQQQPGDHSMVRPASRPKPCRLCVLLRQRNGAHKLLQFCHTVPVCQSSISCRSAKELGVPGNQCCANGWECSMDKTSCQGLLKVCRKPASTGKSCRANDVLALVSPSSAMPSASSHCSIGHRQQMLAMNRQTQAWSDVMLLTIQHHYPAEDLLFIMS